MKAAIIWGLICVGLYLLFPVVHSRQNKCTSSETAFMIAKRFTVETEGLTKADGPDFPWFEPASVTYEGRCTHEVHSYFDRQSKQGRQRVDYAARVHYDPILNRWSLQDWHLS